MTLTQLEYIVSLDAHRHFAKAADRCNVTQPTLSVQIQKLEEELGIMIFDRTKHPVVPTNEGLAIIEQAKEVLRSAKLLTETARSSGERLKGSLRIAILPSLAPYLLPLFLMPFARQHPELQLEVMELHTYQIAGRIAQDRADVGIVISPFGADGFYELPLFQEPVCAYLHPDHPLAAKEVLTAADIHQHPPILTDDTRSMLLSVQQLSDQDDQAEPAPQQLISKDSPDNLHYLSGSVETLRKIVEQQGGITLLPQLATYYMGQRRKKYVRHFSSPQPMRQVSLIVQRGFQKQRLIDAMTQSIQQALPEDFIV